MNKVYIVLYLRSAICRLRNNLIICQYYTQKQSQPKKLFIKKTESLFLKLKLAEITNQTAQTQYIHTHMCVCVCV